MDLVSFSRLAHRVSVFGEAAQSAELFTESSSAAEEDPLLREQDRPCVQHSFSSFKDIHQNTILEPVLRRLPAVKTEDLPCHEIAASAAFLLQQLRGENTVVNYSISERFYECNIDITDYQFEHQATMSVTKEWLKEMAGIATLPDTRNPSDTESAATAYSTADSAPWHDEASVATVQVDEFEYTRYVDQVSTYLREVPLSERRKLNHVRSFVGRAITAGWVNGGLSTPQQLSAWAEEVVESRQVSSSNVG